MANASVTVFPRVQMPSQDFALLIETLTTANSGVIYGCEVTKKSDTELHITEGWCVVRGRTIHIQEGDQTITRPATGSLTKHLIVAVDLQNAAEPAQLSDVETIPADSVNFNVINGPCVYGSKRHRNHKCDDCEQAGADFSAQRSNSYFRSESHGD